MKAGERVVTGKRVAASGERVAASGEREGSEESGGTGSKQARSRV